MIIFSLLLFFILTYAVPFVIGTIFVVEEKEGRPTDKYYAYVMGMLLMVAVFEVFSVAFTFLHLSFTLLCVIYTAVLIVLCIGQLRSRFRRIWKEPSRRQFFGSEPMSLERKIVVAVIFCLLFVEIFLLVWFQSSHFGDNYFHTAAITDALERDVMWSVDPSNGWNEYVNIRYKLGGWDMFLAYLAKMTGTKATMLCYTFLPMFAYPWFYMVAALIGDALADGRHLNKEAVFADYFVLFFGVLLLFGYNTMVSAPGYFANMPWTGRSILYGVCAFLMFYLMLTRFYGDGDIGEDAADGRMVLGKRGMWEIFLLNFASMAFSLTSMLTLFPIEGGIYLLYAIRQKKLFSFWRVAVTLIPYLIAGGFYFGEQIIILLYYIRLWL